MSESSLRDLARTPSVALYLAATFVLQLGVAAQVTALGKRVFDISGQELHLGLLGLAEFGPVALLVLFTGPVADRFDRRRVSAIALAAEAVVAVLLAIEVARADASIGPILVLAVLYAVARAFLNPAFRALMVTIVPPTAVPRMSPLFSGAYQSGIIAGPVIGGFLYTVDVWVPFAFSAACMATAAVLMLGVRLYVAPGATGAAGAPADQPEPAVASEPAAPRGKLAEALEGLSVIRRSPVLLGAISLDLFAVLFGGAVALLPAIAEERLGVGAVGLGWLRAAAGIGAASTTAVLAVRPLQRRIGPTLFVVVGLFGVATIVFGLTHSYVVALAALFALSAADSVSVFIRITLVPLVTPDEVRGRVGAVENVFIGASNELGAFESGLVGQLIGAGPAVALGGAATLVVVAAWSVLFPAIRTLDRFPMPVGATGDRVTSPAAGS